MGKTEEKRFETTNGDGFVFYIESPATEGLKIEVEFVDPGISWTKTTRDDKAIEVVDTYGVSWTEVPAELFRHDFCHRHNDSWSCDVGRTQEVTFPEALNLGRNCNGHLLRVIKTAVLLTVIALMFFLTFVLIKSYIDCKCMTWGKVEHPPAPANDVMRPTRASESRGARRRVLLLPAEGRRGTTSTA